MTEVVLDITVSLDGFVTGPDPGPHNGLGTGGEALHHWVVEGRTEADQVVLDDTVARTGCVVLGRNLFDVVDGPHGWSDGMGYGGARDQSDPPPMVVVTHQAPEHVRLADVFRINTDGIESAITQARDLAGTGDVVVMGGAGVIRSVLLAGLADVLTLHLAPVLLGAGTRLFEDLPAVTRELEVVQRILTPHATHLTYRLPPWTPS